MEKINTNNAFSPVIDLLNAKVAGCPIDFKQSMELLEFCRIRKSVTIEAIDGIDQLQAENKQLRELLKKVYFSYSMGAELTQEIATALKQARGMEG